jgi:hypothetical protein
MRDDTAGLPQADCQSDGHIASDSARHRKDIRKNWQITPESGVLSQG